MTIGSDKTTASDIKAMGSTHVLCSVTEMVVDEEKKMVSTPAYMEAKSIKEAAEGIEKLVAKVLEMV
jgi:enhancing lycopene biosynthesis protein 2